MSGVPPVVFDTPTLGHAARLGELYDHRSSKFLGVQLYPENKVQEVVTNIRNTDLSVSLSTTHQDKASLLDINAKLSLDFAGGLIKVSGSASYLNDEKSNTNEYAYALALKMRLREKRILFAEDDLGRNVLQIAQKDYIATKLATHFVSSVVYGGKFIVNLVARKSELSREQKIEGKLQLQFDKLKGAVNLDGEADAKAREAFKHMDDKFDLTIHGDVALDKVPVNPKDVLAAFPQAATLISDGGGVPIFVTLQPIPPELYKGGLIHKLNADFIDDVLKAFSMLEDLSSRFSVLQDGTKTVREYVPELDRTARVLAAVYTKEHSVLRHQLGEFLQKYQRGEKPVPGSIFSSTVADSSGAADAASQSGQQDEDDQQGKDDETVKDADITGDKVLKSATALYEKHLNPDLPKDDKISKQYRPSLAALEKELLRFQYFASKVQRVRKSLAPPTSSLSNGATENRFHLSSVEDVANAIGVQSKIPLFIMTPLTADNVIPNLAIAQYLALLRTNTALLNDTANPAHTLYAENLGKLDLELGPPGGGRTSFSTLKAPSAFVGTVDSRGKLSWLLVTNSPPDLRLILNCVSSNESLDYVLLETRPLVSWDSFSLRLRVIRNSTTSLPFFYLNFRDGGTRFLELREKPFSALLGNVPGGTTVDLGGSKNRECPRDKYFMVTFVQDTQGKKWTLYLDDEEFASEPFRDNVFNHEPSGVLYLRLYKADKWWTGRVDVVDVFTRALTKTEVEDRHRGTASSNSFQATSVAEDTDLAIAEEEDPAPFISLPS